jgi:hypothetical protein
MSYREFSRAMKEQGFKELLSFQINFLVPLLKKYGDANGIMPNLGQRMMKSRRMR